MSSSTASQPKLQSLISGDLFDILEAARNGQYAEALEASRKLRAAYPQNIFVVALQKQIEKLEEGSATASVDERSHLLNSLPSIIDRAIDDSTRHTEQPEPVNDKLAALDKLRIQYLERAQEQLDKGDWEQALEEVRRVYILSPGDELARLLEQKINALQPPPSDHGADESREIDPETTNEAREIADLAAEETSTHVTTSGKLQRRKSNKSLTIIVLIFVTASVAFISTSFFLKKDQRTVYNVYQVPMEQSYEEVVVDGSAQIQADPIPVQESAVEGKDASTQETKPSQSSEPPPIVRAETNTESPGTKEKAGNVVETQKVVEQPPAVQPTPIEEIAAVHSSPDEPAPEVQQPPAPLYEEKAPSIVRLESVTYPDIARKTKAEGKVVVKVQIDELGKPVQARIVTSTNELFNEAVIEAVMKSQYAAATMPTGPVKSWITVPFNFKR